MSFLFGPQRFGPSSGFDGDLGRRLEGPQHGRPSCLSSETAGHPSVYHHHSPDCWRPSGQIQPAAGSRNYLMSLRPFSHRFRFLFYNAQHSFSDVANLLETSFDTYDIIFIQEQPHKGCIRRSHAATTPTGAPVSGGPSHPQWMCLHGPELRGVRSQVACYINASVHSAFHVAVDTVTFSHPDILVFLAHASIGPPCRVFS